MAPGRHLRAYFATQDVEAAAARFAKEHPETGLITGDAFKVKAVVHGSSDAVVIKLSDTQAAVSQEEPVNAVEEACRRSATLSGLSAWQDVVQPLHGFGLYGPACADASVSSAGGGLT